MLWEPAVVSSVSAVNRLDFFYFNQLFVSYLTKKYVAAEWRRDLRPSVVAEHFVFRRRQKIRPNSGSSLQSRWIQLRLIDRP